MKKKEVKNIYKEFSAVVWKENNWFVSQCLEVEVASQGKTRTKALANLKEALELYFEDDSATDNILPVKSPTVEKLTIASYA